MLFDTIQLGLLAIISSLGLAFGKIIVHYTKEEVKQSQPVMQFAQHALLSTILVVGLWKHSVVIALSVGIVLFLVLALMRKTHILLLTYPLFSFFLTTKTAPFIFLYGITSMHHKRILLPLLIYLVLAFFLDTYQGVSLSFNI